MEKDRCGEVNKGRIISVLIGVVPHAYAMHTFFIKNLKNKN